MHGDMTHCVKLVMTFACSYYIWCIFLYHKAEKSNIKVRMKYTWRRICLLKIYCYQYRQQHLCTSLAGPD